MLCYVMLCYVMLCYVCYVMLCYVMLCYAMLCYVMLCHVAKYSTAYGITIIEVPDRTPRNVGMLPEPAPVKVNIVVWGKRRKEQRTILFIFLVKRLHEVSSKRNTFAFLLLTLFSTETEIRMVRYPLDPLSNQFHTHSSPVDLSICTDNSIL